MVAFKEDICAVGTNVLTSLDKRIAGPSGDACRSAQLFEVSEIN